MKAGSYKELLVWQQAVDLVDEIYVLCRKLPKEEMFGLASQLRRSAVSVSSNIAEGSGCGSRNEFIQYLRIAYGSLCEMETQVLIVERQKLAQHDWGSLTKQMASTGRLLKALIRSLKHPSATSETLETLETS